MPARGSGGRFTLQPTESLLVQDAHARQRWEVHAAAYRIAPGSRCPHAAAVGGSRCCKRLGVGEESGWYRYSASGPPKRPRARAAQGCRLRAPCQTTLSVGCNIKYPPLTRAGMLKILTRTTDILSVGCNIKYPPLTRAGMLKILARTTDILSVGCNIKYPPLTRAGMLKILTRTTDTLSVGCNIKYPPLTRVAMRKS